MYIYTYWAYICRAGNIDYFISNRDVYNIESIVSYRYHKTDTGIVSKWQINNTFSDTFYHDINKDRDSLTQKWMIFFLLNECFVFHFLHHLENYGPWIVLYCMLSIPKGKKLTVWYLLFLINLVHYKLCRHLVFKISVSVSFKYHIIFQIWILPYSTATETLLVV